MKVNKIMINGIVQNLDYYFDLTHLYTSDFGALIMKTEHHICPNCKKNEWVYCPDITTPFVSCFTSECLKKDADITKGFDTKRYKDKMNFR